MITAWLVFGGDEAFELLEPVENDVDVRRDGAGIAANHEESLAIRRDVVLACVVRFERKKVIPVEKRPGDSGLEARRGRGIDRQDGTTVAVKKLRAIRRPERARAPFG